MPGTTTFVLVGHCGADSYSLSHAVSRAVPGSKVIAADDVPSLDAALASPAVLLVNRVLDGSFATDSGVDLIASLASRHPKPTMLLISNYADAQAAAVAAGACPGFGKSQLGSPATVDILRTLASSVSESR